MSSKNRGEKRNVFKMMNTDVNCGTRKKRKTEGWLRLLNTLLMPLIAVLATTGSIVFIQPIIPIAIIIFATIYTPTTFFDASRNLTLTRFGINQSLEMQNNSTTSSLFTAIESWIKSLTISTRNGFCVIFPRILSRVQDFKVNGQERIDTTVKIIMDCESMYPNIGTLILDFIGLTHVAFDYISCLNFIWTEPVCLWTEGQLQRFIMLCMPNNNGMRALVYDLFIKRGIRGCDIVYSVYQVTINDITKKTYGFGNINFINYIFSALRKFDIHFTDTEHPLTYSMHGGILGSDEDDDEDIDQDKRTDALNYV